jgi:hypothetical protein
MESEGANAKRIASFTFENTLACIDSYHLLRSAVPLRLDQWLSRLPSKPGRPSIFAELVIVLTVPLNVAAEVSFFDAFSFFELLLATSQGEFDLHERPRSIERKRHHRQPFGFIFRLQLGELFFMH